jgi:hypothetical protein
MNKRVTTFLNSIPKTRCSFYRARKLKFAAGLLGLSGIAEA